MFSCHLNEPFRRDSLTRRCCLLRHNDFHCPTSPVSVSSPQLPLLLSEPHRVISRGASLLVQTGKTWCQCNESVVWELSTGGVTCSEVPRSNKRLRVESRDRALVGTLVHKSMHVDRFRNEQFRAELSRELSGFLATGQRFPDSLHIVHTA
jgi:hypothetical protein